MRCKPLLAIILLSVSGAPREAVAQYDCMNLPTFSPEDTSIVGTVHELGSGRPLPEIYIGVDNAPLDHTDCQGRFVLPRLWASRHVISTWSQYFYPESTTVRMVGKAPKRIAFLLRRLPPAPPPVDSLLGRWNLTLFAGPRANGSIITAGALFVTSGRGSPLGTFQPAAITMDFGPLWGPGWKDPPETPDTVHVQIAGDTVSIHLTPFVSDAGFSLHGFFRDSHVSGTWCEHNFAHDCTTRGDFVMARRRDP